MYMGMIAKAKLDVMHQTGGKHLLVRLATETRDFEQEENA